VKLLDENNCMIFYNTSEEWGADASRESSANNRKQIIQIANLF